MAFEHIVVDGSNIATEGRSTPSLEQLETAVKELRREYPDAEVTVIVDATFAHRIDAGELPRFELGVLSGEFVHPPAGAIGRGDAFLLRVAEKVDATALSNDSFQEFHGEHPWLFDRGRLIGGTPVPGVGWIFTPRTPVRGPTSRKAVKDTDRAKRQVSKAIEAATKEAVAPDGAPSAKADGERGATRRSERSRAAATTAPAAVNDPLTFISFIAEHPLGTEVEGQVSTYTSHGAVVMMGSTQGYLPLANLADPPPRSAREILKRGEHRRFVVKALDPLRRGVELALPGVSRVSGQPSEEMIAAEMRIAKKRAPAKSTKAKARAEKAPKKRAENAPKKMAKAPTKAATKASKASAAALAAAGSVPPAEPAADLKTEAAGTPVAAPGEERAAKKGPSRKRGGAKKAAVSEATQPAASDKAAAAAGGPSEQDSADVRGPADPTTARGPAPETSGTGGGAPVKKRGRKAAPLAKEAAGVAPGTKAPAKAVRKQRAPAKRRPSGGASSPPATSLVGGEDGTPRRRRRSPSSPQPGR